MEYVGTAIIALVVFGVCFAFDKLFSRLFRNQKEHTTGKSVRMDSKSAVFGLIAGVLGISALFMGGEGGWLFYVGGCVLVLIGAVLVIQYVSFGVFYDEDTFLVVGFGKKERRYRFSDIQGQKLYNSQGNIVIELFLADGDTLLLQSTMKGVYPFMDEAFGVWLRQTGRKMEDCSFYDPHTSRWFPPMEE